jgi:hypothetical protein
MAALKKKKKKKALYRSGQLLTCVQMYLFWISVPAQTDLLVPSSVIQIHHGTWTCVMNAFFQSLPPLPGSKTQFEARPLLKTIPIADRVLRYLSRYSAGLRAGRSVFWGSIPGGGWEFFSSPLTPERLQPPIQCATGALSLAVKLKLTAHLHLAPRSKNEWSYTSTPPIRLHGVVLS